MKLKKLKKGDIFALKKIITSEKALYVRDEYDRSTRKYIVYNYDDVNHFRQWKGDKEVFADFTNLRDLEDEVPY